MRKSFHKFRIFLCTFSGEDHYIIRTCGTAVQLSFAAIGAFVILIFAGCYYSAYNFFHSLFSGNYFISIPIGILWALLVTNMYLLLLYTVCPPLLPSRKRSDTGSSQSSFFTLSMVFRITFLILLAVIIAQPFNVEVFSKSVASSLQNYKMEERVKMIVISDSLLIKNEVQILNDFYNHVARHGTNADNDSAKQRLKVLWDKVEKDKNFVVDSKVLLDSIQKFEQVNFLNSVQKNKRDSLFGVLAYIVDDEVKSDHNFITEIDQQELGNAKLQEEYGKFKATLKIAIQNKIDNYDKLDHLISKSNFYIKRIQLILYEVRLSWLLTFTVCGLFLLPIYFKYKVRDNTNFYSKRSQAEHDIIMRSYNVFKEQFSTVLQSNTTRYNIRSLSMLEKHLNQIEGKGSIEGANLRREIEQEYKKQIFEKYEYWADNPFRTKKKLSKDKIGSEDDFIKTIYS